MAERSSGLASGPPSKTEIVAITEPTSAEDVVLREQSYEIRVEVFYREQGFPLDTEFDEYDATATHLLMRNVPEHTPVGTIRAVRLARDPASGRARYKLSRLAVLAQYRARRFGRALVQALHEWVQRDAAVAGERDAVEIVTHSQIYVKGFYARSFGYEPKGDEFDEDGAPHQKMVVCLTPLS